MLEEIIVVELIFIYIFIFFLAFFYYYYYLFILVRFVCYFIYSFPYCGSTFIQFYKFIKVGLLS